jgi:hypothetical protein
MDANQPGVVGVRYCVRSDRTCVTGALEKDRNALEHRFDPLLLCSAHSWMVLIGVEATWVKLFFDKTNVPAAFDAGEANFGNTALR